jgi:hypothetical protein
MWRYYNHKRRSGNLQRLIHPTPSSLTHPEAIAMKKKEDHMNREEIAKIENKILLHHNSANPKKWKKNWCLHTHTRTHQQDREHGTSNQYLMSEQAATSVGGQTHLF